MVSTLFLSCSISWRGFVSSIKSYEHAAYLALLTKVPIKPELLLQVVLVDDGLDLLHDAGPEKIKLS